MKKLSVFLFLCFVSLSVFAYNENNKVYFGIEGGTYSYREPHMEYPIHLSTNKKIGASIEWTSRNILSLSSFDDEDDKSFTNFELRYITGKTDYDGFLMDGTPHYTKGEKDWYWEGRITLGRTYALGDDFLELWPYLGFGYRYLVNDGSKVDSTSYKRISKYVYIPIGTKIKKTLSNNITLTFTGEFDWFITGKQTSKLEGIDIVNDQKKGWGARFGIKAEAPLSKKIGVFVEPYYRIWKIQNSNTFSVYEWTGSGWIEHKFLEPFNTTKEAGIKAGFYF